MDNLESLKLFILEAYRNLVKISLALVLLFGAQAATAVQLFSLTDVRLTASPFLKAQTANLRYLMALDPDKLLAPFRREAGLPAACRRWA